MCPPWQGGSHGEAELLAQCYRSCLQLAVQHSIRSLAFPAIGTGEMGFPLKIATRIAFRETSRFLMSNSSIGEILFVCFDRQTLRCYQDEFNKVAGW